ncbi:recombinase family protein [Peribacillus simplex]
MEHYTEYAIKKNGYELINVYTDEGTSATSPKREKFH